MSRSIGLVVLGAVALLAGLFLLLKPSADTAHSHGPAGPSKPLTASERELAQTVELEISGGRLVSGPNRIPLLQGQAVRLLVTADETDELHLHGYDLTLDLPAGLQAELAFVAEHAGRFEYELHSAHRVIGALEVQPR